MKPDVADVERIGPEPPILTPSDRSMPIRPRSSGRVASRVADAAYTDVSRYR